MLATFSETALGVVSGSIVGFSLGLVGGGGSILAVPLLVYVVGVANPHIAIGTSAIAVAVSAASNLAQHTRSGIVVWRCAVVFAAAGVAGAFIGSSLGKMVDGQKLLVLFAGLMIIISALMLKRRSLEGNAEVKLTRKNLPKLATIGVLTGALAGFFGIGGGFLIVPGLMLATGMPILNAVGSSLVAVTAFGMTTAINYSVSGLVNWTLAGIFIGGGVLGGIAGAAAARTLASRRGALNIVFAIILFCVALYMLYGSLEHFLSPPSIESSQRSLSCVTGPSVSNPERAISRPPVASQRASEAAA
jgi:uncharacterized membrane protein YfcA